MRSGTPSRVKSAGRRTVVIQRADGGRDCRSERRELKADGGGRVRTLADADDEDAVSDVSRIALHGGED